MVWMIKNLGLTLLGMCILLAVWALCDSMDKWTNALNANTKQVAIMSDCTAAVADHLPPVVKKGKLGNETR